MTETKAAGRLEFVGGKPAEGEILAVKLRREMVSPEDALRYALDIGIALSRAHAQGLVHGKLSPQSILINESGAVLLKPLPGENPAAGYRAPEQAPGNSADTRSDIFAFGALLHELVSGDAPFQPDDSAPNAAIREADPPAIESTLAIHRAMEKVIAGCLEKNPATRRQRMQNVVSELKLTARTLARREPGSEQRAFAVASTPADARLARDSNGADASPRGAQRSANRARPAVRPRRVRQSAKTGFRLRAWIVIAAALLLCAGGVTAVKLLPGRNPARVYRYSIDPQDAKFSGTPAVSPDGRSLTWTALGPVGKRMLWLQPLDGAHAMPISNTEGAAAPFWSPDSSHIAFFANGFLMKVRVQDAVASGKPARICPVDVFPGGGAWGKNGTIVFAASLTGGLSRVAASGGTPRALTRLNPAKNERSHLWPQFLPDARHFVFFVGTDNAASTGVYAGSIDSDRYNLLLSSATNAVYSGERASGYLLHIRDGSLVGEPFNPSKLALSGDSITLATAVDAVGSLSFAQISVSDNGTLVYESAGKPARELSWIDRAGKSLGTVGEPGDWGPPRISPDGARVAVGKRDPNSGFATIWIWNTADGSAFQLTHQARGSSAQPVWSPDGSRIAFSSDELGAFDLYIQPVTERSQAELVYRTGRKKTFDDWSRDGRTLLFDEFTPGTSRGLMMWNPAARKASTIVDTIHSEGYGAISPDGKWLAYQTDETGTNEIVVQAFDNGSPGTKKLFPVSQGGGALPRWRGDGQELYYMTQPGKLMAVTVHPSGDELSFDPPHELFHLQPTPKAWNLYDVSADGERFAVNTPMDWPGRSKIVVIGNWAKEPARVETH